VTDHVAANERHLEDVLHSGRVEELNAPANLIWPSLSKAHTFLSVNLGTDPSSSNPALRRAYLIAEDEREMLYMDPRQAEEFAESAIAFGFKVLAMARLAGGQA
jgi:hypothetical protein